MVDVVCHTGVEIFVPLARYERVAGVASALAVIASRLLPTTSSTIDPLWRE